MRILTLTTNLCFILTTTHSMAFDKNHKNTVFIDEPLNVCWYQGQKYSEGALIKQFDMLFACSNKHPKQTNSRVVWVKADASGVPIKLDPERTIRVK
ncbi:DUF1496 domain-containing protein [Pseudoalteromonas sp. MMG013]|uniref:DUF1496 domain-containing protein n=1 Tax=Pseudoalteromonas aurantia 208 TaxID=1314867 RepID=A0ABR9EJ88_9GAMM|nr:MULTISPECIES: DUF1496 domain-containing protein [Pseudoalteromonas]MBE0371061.1 hypothetical protein [Pseudoalteromonas aurantia 208]MBQ4847273.1 DUF1496 domain-containing protein [Pseudoalteromonas sp. MMG005]MBQ4860175.1 DUF1496 domain-containing protein [Pseudoalteromonas sp. MMG013]